MHRPSNSNYKSWTTRATSHSVPSNPNLSPAPMPGTPHLYTVSLPHPNSVPYYASSSQYNYEGSSTSGILSINPLLSGSGSTGVPMYFNVTKDVQCIHFQGSSTNLLDTPAIWPSRSVLILSFPSLPLWSTIEVRNPSGVTARDVLIRIRDVLSRSVSAQEMGTMGMKRIDFLGPNVLFAGLWRSRDGQDRWEVRFVNA